MTAPVAPGTGAFDAGRDAIVARRATDEDAPRLAELARRTFIETFAADNAPDDMAIHLAQAFGPAVQLGEIRDSNMITLLIEIGPALAGFAQVRRGPTPACVTGAAPVEILRFYVDRPFHGRGVAQRLMRDVEQLARELGHHTLWLGVWELNPRAIAFYTKCGFVDVGHQAFILGTEEQTDRVMARAL